MNSITAAHRGKVMPISLYDHIGSIRHEHTRSHNFFPGGAGADVTVHVFGTVHHAVFLDFFCRRPRVVNEPSALLGERGLRFE